MRSYLQFYNIKKCGFDFYSPHDVEEQNGHALGHGGAGGGVAGLGLARRGDRVDPQLCGDVLQVLDFVRHLGVVVDVDFVG